MGGHYTATHSLWFGTAVNISAIRERVSHLLSGCKCATGCTTRRCSLLRAHHILWRLPLELFILGGKTKIAAVLTLASFHTLALFPATAFGEDEEHHHFQDLFDPEDATESHYSNQTCNYYIYLQQVQKDFLYLQMLYI